MPAQGKKELIRNNHLEPSWAQNLLENPLPSVQKGAGNWPQRLAER